MVLAELVYGGRGGLGELVAQLSTAIEGVLARHGRSWSANYPITLREALGMGLQQQVLGGYPRAVDPGHDLQYHVWVALPEGGAAAWVQELAWRMLQGCSQPQGTPPLVRDLEETLLLSLAPCLRRSGDLPGLAPLAPF